MDKSISLLVIFIIIITIISCYNGNKIKGSGNIISENRELTNFSSISLMGNMDVNIKYFDEYNCTVISDDNLIPYIKTEVINNNLQISIKKNYSSTEGIKVNVNIPAYDEVSILGSGDINIIDFKNNKLSLNISGSGDITARGEVQKLLAKINGSGDIISKELLSRDATITINGSGDATIWASNSINAKINGSGDIKYYGNPIDTKTEVNGSGNISSE
mgnify:CR=1 FL=1